MATVYRVEIGLRGQGPYHSEFGTSGALLYDLGLEDARCPAPRDRDGGDLAVHRHLRESGWDELDANFGFADRDQYLAWFHTEEARAYLADNGFALVEYEVPDADVFVSGHQAVFLGGEPVGAFDCRDLEPLDVARIPDFRGLFDGLERRVRAGEMKRWDMHGEAQRAILEALAEARAPSAAMAP